MRRRGFTLIELLVVIGIILILMAIIVTGVRHINATAASRETNAELQVCNDMLQEYANVNGRGSIEGPVSGGQVADPNPDPNAPKSPGMFPIYMDDVIGSTTPTVGTYVALGDLGEPVGAVTLSGNQLSGDTDMGNKSPGQNVARYYAPAVQRTFDVMYVLLRDPKNRALVNSMPPKRILEIQQSMNGQSGGNQSLAVQKAWNARAIILDGWGDPIIYVPAGGLHVSLVDASTGTYGQRNEYIVRSTGTFLASDLKNHPITTADRPFWASAGQDGDFAKGEDNVYSFQK